MFQTVISKAKPLLTEPRQFRHELDIVMTHQRLSCLAQAALSPCLLLVIFDANCSNGSGVVVLVSGF